MSAPPTPVIILVRPQMPENIGMAARAMANFGLSRLRLVAPREGWPQKTRMKKGAWQAASGATHILEAAELFDTVEAALADLSLVFATTARERGQAKDVLAPEAAVARIASPATTGLMFGPERTGLENDEISLASAVISFPVVPEFASLNLAQAVLLTSYEWFKQTQGGAPPIAMPHQSPPARRASLFAFFDFVETALDAVHFFHPAHRRPVMVRNFRNIFHRMNPTEQDVRTLRGALDALLTGGKPSRRIAAAGAGRAEIAGRGDIAEGSGRPEEQEGTISPSQPRNGNDI